MRHLRCLTCRARLYSTEGDPIGDLCPFCGSPLAALAHPATMVMAIGYSPCTAAGSTERGRRVVPDGGDEFCR
jgi:hypothetical protein